MQEVYHCIMSVAFPALERGGGIPYPGPVQGGGVPCLSDGQGGSGVTLSWFWLGAG